MYFIAHYQAYDCGVKMPHVVEHRLPYDNYAAANKMAHAIEEIYNKENYEMQIYLIGVTVYDWKKNNLKGGGHICNT